MVVTGSDGRELWRTEFLHELDANAMRTPDALVLTDLNGDGLNEVLVRVRFADPQLSDSLVCLANEGQPLWNFAPGRAVKTRTEAFDPIYSIDMVKVWTKASNGEHQLIVSAGHRSSYPSQVALLDHSGRILREYWHSGHLPIVTTADLNGDGEEEIYLGGVSQATHAATLVGMRLSDFAGASLETNLDFQLTGFPPAHETVRILFRRSDLNQATATHDEVGSFVTAQSAIDVDTYETPEPNNALVHYRLNSHYDLVDASAGDYFPVRHDRLFREGRLDHRFNPRRDIEPLRNITYLRRP
jgi:hypothetical protein